MNNKEAIVTELLEKLKTLETLSSFLEEKISELQKDFEETKEAEARLILLIRAAHKELEKLNEEQH